MATTAIYSINGVLNYNHYDNYPAGAAFQLFEVAKKYRNLSLYSIIRGIESLTPIDNIQNEGYQYYYIIENDYIKAYKVNDDNDEIYLISEGIIHEWINSNLILEKKDNIVDYTLVHAGSLPKAEKMYFVLSILIEKIKNKFDTGKSMLLAGHIGNASSLFYEVFLEANKFNLDVQELKDIYLTECVPILVEKYNHDNSNHFASYTEGEK